MSLDFKANSRAKELNKARIDRVRLLVDDIHDDVDEDGVKLMEERINEIGERYEFIDTRINRIVQEEVGCFNGSVISKLFLHVISLRELLNT